MRKINQTKTTFYPLVSIIVPVYNAEKYLMRCLDSLVSQTISEKEILCVNDGSTDKSLEILTSYAEKYPFLYVFNQENQGPGAARNIALDNAKGKYIIFCDADDTLESNACFECSMLMEKYNTDIIIFNVNIMEVDRVEISRKKKFGRGEYISIVHPDLEGLLSKKEFSKIAINASIWGYFYRSELVNHFNLRFTNYRAGEDGIFFLSYLIVMQSGYALNKTLYTYYAHKGSLADIAYKKGPWLYRLFSLPKFIFLTLKFSLKNNILFKQLCVFYWMFFYLKSKI